MNFLQIHSLSKQRRLQIKIVPRPISIQLLSRIQVKIRQNNATNIVSRPFYQTKWTQYYTPYRHHCKLQLAIFSRYLTTYLTMPSVVRTMMTRITYQNLMIIMISGRCAKYNRVWTKSTMLALHNYAGCRQRVSGKEGGC